MTRPITRPIVLGEKIGFKRTPKQKEVLDNPSRFKIWKAGRRGAKTYGEAYFVAKNAIQRRDKHWYVTTTLALAREEFFPVLLDLLPRDLVAKTDDRQLYVRLTTGSTIYCKSAEKEKNLRGRGLGSVVLDEAAFIRPGVWDQILRPQLAGSRGPALLASSPKKGWFTQLYNRVLQEQMPDWAAFHSTIYDNPHISREEIETIKATTPVNTWLQEYMAEEISEAGQVYDEFGSHNIYDPREKFQDIKTHKTIRGMDWGVSDPTGVVWCGITPEGWLVLSEEHEQKGWDPARQAETIIQKSAGYTIHANILDGTAFRKESSLVSVADQFRDAGIVCQKSEKDVNASLAIFKRFLRGDGVTPWLYVSAKCNRLIQALQEWEHGDHEPDIAAAARYAVTHAVVHRLTRLADTIPSLNHASLQRMKEDDAKLVLASQARIVRTSKKRAWSWDSVAGIPY